MSKQKIKIMVAVAALCAVVAGCIRDTQAASSSKSDGSAKLRYYGGPKSSMWSGQ
jgi:hypothetical protein